MSEYETMRVPPTWKDGSRFDLTDDATGQVVEFEIISGDPMAPGDNARVVKVRPVTTRGPMP